MHGHDPAELSEPSLTSQMAAFQMMDFIGPFSFAKPIF